MKIEEFDGKDVRKVLIGMIVDDKVLERIAQIWPRGRHQSKELMESRWANLIGGMCVQHYRKHKQAPRKAIEDLFREWGEAHQEDTDTIRLVSMFLGELNGEYVQSKGVDSDHTIDLAERYFNRVAIRRLGEYLINEGSNTKLDEGRNRIAQFEPISLRGPTAIPADEVELEVLRWLWPGWLAFGEMAMFDGFPGQGKSLLTYDIAARLTRGGQMPPHEDIEGVAGKKHSVVIVSNEDSWNHTIVPRLMAAGAVLSRVFKPNKDKDIVTLPGDIPLIERIIKQSRAKLLIIDPIMGCIGSEKTDTNSESHVRRFLAPLLEMTRKTGIATALVRHFKKESASAMHRGIGSQAWTAFCRLQHVVGRDEESGMTILAAGKNNLTAKPQSQGFHVVSEQISAVIKDKKQVLETARIEWVGDVEFTADEIAKPQRNCGRGRPSKIDEAIERIMELLANGPMDSTLLMKKVMNDTGVSERTFKEAKKKAGVKFERIGFGEGGRSMSYIPNEEKEAS